MQRKDWECFKRWTEKISNLRNSLGVFIARWMRLKVVKDWKHSNLGLGSAWGNFSTAWRVVHEMVFRIIRMERGEKKNSVLSAIPLKTVWRRNASVNSADQVHSEPAAVPWWRTGRCGAVRVRERPRHGRQDQVARHSSAEGQARGEKGARGGSL